MGVRQQVAAGKVPRPRMDQALFPSPTCARSKPAMTTCPDQAEQARLRAESPEASSAHRPCNARVTRPFGARPSLPYPAPRASAKRGPKAKLPLQGKHILPKAPAKASPAKKPAPAVAHRRANVVVRDESDEEWAEWTSDEGKGALLRFRSQPALYRTQGYTEACCLH